MFHAHATSALTGQISVPGDKSISHRAVIFGGLGVGKTTITNLLEGEDVLATIAALRAMGVNIIKRADDSWEVIGVGVGGLREPDDVLDFGNSGTSTRLLLGCLAAIDGCATICGDASLRARPMLRVLAPLQTMGMEYLARSKGRLPLTIKGAGAQLLPIDYKMPIPSAQVKSCLLLAGLHCRGETRIHEPSPTRDHTERMLAQFGAQLSQNPLNDGCEIILQGQQDLHGCAVAVPGDPSSAAFVIAAALIVPDSDVTLRNVSLNEGRTGFLQTLQEMGADITISNRTTLGEPAGDIRVRYSDNLQGVEVPQSRAASMIDEYPILSVVAAYAKGTTLMKGLAELRVKESDRLAAVLAGLLANHVSVTAGDDWLQVEGGKVQGGGVVATHLDHRIAMSFLILGLQSKAPACIDDADAIKTSFPDFMPLMTGLGCEFVQAD